MAKATGKTGSASEEKKSKKPAATRAVATKAKAKSPAKRVAKKVVAKKKPAATKAKAPAKVTKVAKTIKSKRRTTAVRSKTTAARKATVAKKQTTRSRRVRAAMLEVSPAVIDTSSAAEVAARMVADHTASAPADPFGLIFTPPPAVVKRGSSALRHVKEALHKPVAAQLESVFGPAPVPPQAMKRFLRGEKVSRTQRVRGNTSFHSGQPTVPHRSVG